MVLITIVHCYNIKSGNSYPISEKLILSLALFLQIYLMASLVLFAVISYMSTSVLKSFHQEVQVWNDVNVDRISLLESSDLLEMWKRRVQLIWKTLEALDNCFSWTLFLSVSFLCISFVAQSFDLYLCVMNNDSALKIVIDASYLAFLIIELSLICIPVDDRQHQVN